MNKVINLQEAIKITSQLKSNGRTIVLSGGCFDIIHPGHLIYLEKAKAQGDVLFVALENDSNVRRLKGKGRPVNSQLRRAKQLTKLSFVDYIILLPSLLGYRRYFDLTQKLSPDIIAITEGDLRQKEKEIQAKAIGSRVVSVVKHHKKYSTTKLLKQQ